MHLKNKRTKISIVGAGNVGSTTAYTLMVNGFANEIVIVDVNKQKAEGEAMDMSQGLSFVRPVNIISGDYKDTADSDIVIITAGAGRKPGESRLDLINKNLQIFKSMIPEIVKYNPNSILLVVSNPMDILSYITYKLSGFPSERIIGSGTVLDTSRFKYALGQHFDVDGRNIHTYIIGEHGDTELATWSVTNIAGMGIDKYCDTCCGNCDSQFKYNIYEHVKNAGRDVIERKGATFYAIALAINRIVEAIIRDENSILTVSSLLEGQFGLRDMYMGMPSIVGAQGVKKILEIPLSEKELNYLRESAKALRETLDKLEI